MSGQPAWDPSSPYVPGRGFSGPAPVTQTQPPPPPPRGDRNPAGWVTLVIITIIVVVGLVVWLVVRGPGTSPPDRPATGAAQPSAKACPTYPTPSPVPSISAGRVTGGLLSYPRLPAPWSAPQVIFRTPYTISSNWQWIATEKSPSGEPIWVSGVEIGELTSGDGLPMPADAHELVLDCILGTYETAVARTYVASRAMQVSNRPAWFVEAHLTFDKPGIKAKGETVLLVLVRTDPDSTSMLYASIPDGNPTHLADARTAMAGLQVT